MKKLVLLLVVILTTGALAQAQMFTLGVKAGLSSSSVDFKDIKGTTSDFKEGDNITGFHAGAFARVSVMGFLVQPEMVFSSSGGKIESAGDVQDVNFSHLDVPVLLGYSFFKIARVYAGPVASILINSEFGNEKASKYLDTADWGFQVGAGVDISRLTADLRYERLTRSYANSGESYDITGQQVIFSLGYKFIGK
ncbi:porin family protein [Rufibacter ruber]|uniref:porin family protein n=1 Tax=Rufibacter ruber TaxID=1783499 RepID=UPI00082C965D|nr:porin family protein [Rufibacter ruber]